jgi:lipopolysaccharide cholinephosphotransferase
MKKKILVYLFIFFVAIIIFRNWYVENVLKEKMKPLHNKLIEMLPITIKYLDEEGIKWILYSGNLLGMYRHKNSFIPWDDDIDLAIFKEDDTLEDRLKRVNEKLKNHKMHLRDTPFGYAIHNDDENSILGNKAYIDLFIYEKRGNIWMGNEWHQNMFPNEYFKEEMLFPFKKGIFEGIEVNIPNDSIGWLKQNYGEKSLTTAKLTGIHQANSFEKLLVKYTRYIPLYF